MPGSCDIRDLIAVRAVLRWRMVPISIRHGPPLLSDASLSMPGVNKHLLGKTENVRRCADPMRLTGKHVCTRLVGGIRKVQISASCHYSASKISREIALLVDVQSLKQKRAEAGTFSIPSGSNMLIHATGSAGMSSPKEAASRAIMHATKGTQMT